MNVIPNSAGPGPYAYASAKAASPANTYLFLNAYPIAGARSGTLSVGDTDGHNSFHGIPTSVSVGGDGDCACSGLGQWNGQNCRFDLSIAADLSTVTFNARSLTDGAALYSVSGGFAWAGVLMRPANNVNFLGASIAPTAAPAA